LVVALGGLEHGGVNAEGVGGAAAGLDPDGGGDRRPRIGHPLHRPVGDRMDWVVLFGLRESTKHAKCFLR